MQIGKKVIRPNLATEKVGLSRSTLDRLEKANLFPKRIKLGANSVGWFEDELDKWLEERAKAE